MASGRMPRDYVRGPGQVGWLFSLRDSGGGVLFLLLKMRAPHTCRYACQNPAIELLRDPTLTRVCTLSQIGVGSNSDHSLDVRS